MYVYDKNINNSITKGACIEINGVFEKGSESRNFNGFNYDEYLRSEKIIGIINSNKINIIRYKKYSFFDDIHNKIKKKIVCKTV